MANVLGTSADDTLATTAENDSIWGGSAGFDTAVYTGAFADYIISDNGDGSYTVEDERAGAPDGIDKVRSIERFAFSDLSVSLEDFLAAMRRDIFGTQGDDTLLGTDGDDTFIASGGNDAIWGGMAGEDRIVYAGNLADYRIVLSDNGAHYVYDLRDGQPQGVDKVRAVELFQFQDGTFTLAEFVEASRDPDLTLTGTSGNDTLSGEDGNDTLIPLDGLDRVWGGFEGHDTAVFQGNFDDYVVTDNRIGSLTIINVAGGVDGTNIVRDVESFVFADRTVDIADIFSGAATQNRVSVREVYGTSGNDRLSAAHTDGLLDAHTNDLMVGGGGADVLRGGAGDDAIYGDHNTVAGGIPEFTDHPATDLPRFTVAGAFYAVADGQLYQIDPLGGASTTIGPVNAAIDSFGINPLDGYAYGIGTKGTTNGELFRLGLDGNVESLGGKFTSTKTGAFHADGTYYIVTGGRSMTAIDVETLESTDISFGGASAGSAKDIAIVGDIAYGLTNNGTLVKWDLVSHEITQSQVNGTTTKGQFGAVWATENGDLIVNQTKSGSLYKISDIASASPVATRLADGVTGNAVDGFSYGVLESTDLTGGNDRLQGGAGMDQLFGGAGKDCIEGGADADTMDGGAGFDSVSYRNAESGVTVDLETGTGSRGDAAGDVFINFEQVIGSNHDDVFHGSAQTDRVNAGAGDDVFHESGGNDRLWGGFGNDTMFFAGELADYKVRRVGDPGRSLDPRYEDDFFYVVKNLDTGDVARVRDVETITFADVAIDTDTNSYDSIL